MWIKTQNDELVDIKNTFISINYKSYVICYCTERKIVLGRYKNQTEALKEINIIFKLLAIGSLVYNMKGYDE